MQARKIDRPEGLDSVETPGTCLRLGSEKYTNIGGPRVGMMQYAVIGHRAKVLQLVVRWRWHVKSGRSFFLVPFVPQRVCVCVCGAIRVISPFLLLSFSL